MQILSPQPGLLPYPNADFGQQMEGIGQTIFEFAKLKKQIEEDKASKRLDLYLKTGEITGELDKPTPEIQKAFKKIYGIEPTGIFATGGETLAGKKAKTELKKTEAEITSLGVEDKRKAAMADWYSRRTTADKNTDVKALDYAVKYANSKLGKPFEVLTDEERGMWQGYHDEGMQEYFKVSGKTPAGGVKSYDAKQQGFINSWKSLSANEKNKITNKDYQIKLNKKLQALGLTMQDLK